MNNVTFFTAPGLDFSPATLSAVPIVTRGLALAAVKAGWETAVVAAKSPNPLFPDLATIPVAFSPAPKAGLRLLARRLERKLLQQQSILHRRWVAESATAISAVCPPGGVVIAPAELELDIDLARALPNRKFAILFHDCKFACKPRYFRKLADSGIVLCAVSNFTARAAERFFNLQPGAVHTVYNAVDHSIFFPKPRAPGGPPVISFHGRSVPEKGVDILLEAAVMLAKRGKKFEMQIAGSNRGLNLDLSDPYQRLLTGQIASLADLGIPIRRLGNVNWMELPAYLQAADIHVCPHRWDEAFGMANIEGMACGLATVAAKSGGTPEVVGDAGLLFGRENVDQLAANLEKLIMDEPFRTELGRRAHRQALKFTWDNSWASLIRCIVTR